MRKYTQCFAWLAGIILFLLQMPVYSQNKYPETELHQAIKNFNQAFMQADVATLDNLLTEQYLHTNSGNKAFNKASWLKWVGSRQDAVKSGQLKYDSYLTEDLSIIIYQNSAVVTGRNIAKGISAYKPFNVDIRFTHLWVKQQGKWKRASFHDAPVK